MNLKNLLLGNITQEDFFNYYNISVKYIDIPYKNVRGFVDYYNNIYFIYINNNLSKTKRKKTLLHELAHIELNQLEQIDKDLFEFNIQKYEDEADQYIKFLLENINYDLK